MAKKNTVSFNVIDTFCQLSEALADSGMRYIQKLTDTLESETPKTDGKELPMDDIVSKNLPILSDYLHVSLPACLIFVVIYSLQLSTREDIDWCDICKFLNVNAIKSLRLRHYLEELVKNGIIICQNPNRRMMFRSYCVHRDVETAIDANVPFHKRKNKELDRYQFCSKVSQSIYLDKKDAYA